MDYRQNCCLIVNFLSSYEDQDVRASGMKQKAYDMICVKRFVIYATSKILTSMTLTNCEKPLLFSIG